MSNVKPLTTEQLRWRCDTSCIDTTDVDVESFQQIIGQRRAVEAVQMGLEMDQPGYNIFVTGMSGTGRTTTIHRMLRDIEKSGKIPDDVCYVNNFKDADRPTVIQLSAGSGCRLRANLEQLLENLKTGVPAVFEHEEYQNQRKKATAVYQERRQKIIKGFEDKLKEKGFTMTQVQMGPFTRPDVLPVIDGKPTTIEDLNALVQQEKFPAEKLEELIKTREELTLEMVQAFKETQKIDEEMKEALVKLDRGIITPIIHEMMQQIHDHYKNEKLGEFLNDLEEHIMENLNRFRTKTPEKEQGEGDKDKAEEGEFGEFQVNVLVDNSKSKGRPVIVETSPTHRNLFGTIERLVDRRGIWQTDFSKVKAGSFLRANGGFLVINAWDALVEPGVWETLKRTLRNRKAEIQTFDPQFKIYTGSLKPEPIDVNVKVVVVGESNIYYLLRELDHDFAKIFKVKADFDTVMPRDEKNVQEYVSFVRVACKQNKLRRFNKSGVAQLMEFGVRLAGDQNKLSTRFHVIADVMREADYWAGKGKSKTVMDIHVDQAIKAWQDRVSLWEDKFQERIHEGTLYIDTEGEVVGQINGLSVYDLGEYMFGLPSRITAQTSLGRSGVINIEREAELSGHTHNKGVLILSGYLQGKFAQEKPMAMNASICFEQSYGGVDGDSASSTEIYAILSSLAEVPIRQDLAVTGSVNQRGDIQPIGGVNEKIEGYFRVCNERGLSGTQGVIIPKSNVQDLMLKDEVVQAVADGKFQVYSIERVEEGVELLMGAPAGEQDSKGQYPKDSVFGKVDAKLKVYAELIKDYLPGK